MNHVLVAVISIPCAIWFLYRITLANMPTEFDFDTSHSTFTLLLGHYTALARGMVVIDLAAALAGKCFNVSTDAIGLLLAGAICAFTFNVYLLTVYEMYLGQRYPRDGSPGTSNYTPAKYAMTRALGFSAAIFTVVGVVAAVLA